MFGLASSTFNANNAREVKRRWNLEWPNIAPTIRTTVLSVYQKFQREGTCRRPNKGHSSRIRTSRSQQNINHVRQLLEKDGRQSFRRNGLRLSQSNFVCIVREIKFHPYVVIRKQKLKPGNPPQRLALCNWFMKTIRVEGKFSQNLIVSDEASFSLNSEANSGHFVQYAKRGKGYPNNHYVDFDPGEDKVMVGWD